MSFVQGSSNSTDNTNHHHQQQQGTNNNGGDGTTTTSNNNNMHNQPLPPSSPSCSSIAASNNYSASNISQGLNMTSFSQSLHQEQQEEEGYRRGQENELLRLDHQQSAETSNSTTATTSSVDDLFEELKNLLRDLVKEAKDETDQVSLRLSDVGRAIEGLVTHLDQQQYRNANNNNNNDDDDDKNQNEEEGEGIDFVKNGIGKLNLERARLETSLRSQTNRITQVLKKIDLVSKSLTPNSSGARRLREEETQDRFPRTVLPQEHSCSKVNDNVSQNDSSASGNINTSRDNSLNNARLISPSALSFTYTHTNNQHHGDQSNGSSSSSSSSSGFPRM